jgi:hypothetical protein
LQTAHTETQQKLTSAQSELEKLQSTQNSDMKKAIENVRSLNGKIFEIIIITIFVYQQILQIQWRKCKTYKCITMN